MTTARFTIAAALLLALGGCAAPLTGMGGTGSPRPPLCGVDASSLPAVLAHGGRFLDGDAPVAPLELYRRHGIDTIRLRLFVNPAAGGNDLPRVVEEARRARELGFRIFLDLHYSDDWADPGHQAKPRSWAGDYGTRLEERVESYTRDVMFALRGAGVTPHYVQIGNEITNGFLWPEGRLNATPGDNWPQLAKLLARACAAVRSAAAARPDPEWPTAPGDPLGGPRIVLHLDAGGDNLACRTFLNQVEAFRIDYDVIGLSYYPWWHGRLEQLEANLDDLAERYRKPIVLCETAYPWTLQWRDAAHNLVGRADQLLPGYAATPEGQRMFLEALRRIINRVPRGLGLGIVYWSPDWLAAPGVGSPWENMTLFDFEGRMLPGLEALGGPGTGVITSP